MNVLINIKSAEKGLQFGITKCKSMLIGKDLENVPNSNLTVDSWKVSHIDIPGTGVEELMDKFPLRRQKNRNTLVLSCPVRATIW